MGNLTCIPKKELEGADNYVKHKRNSKSERKMEAEQKMLHHQALAMAIHQHQLSQRFDGSLSRRMMGSTSSRRHDISDRFCANQIPVDPDTLETRTIVLIHGEGFGAWCWYKIIPLLEEAGLQPIALDLAGSGTNHTDANTINSIAEYSKPLTDFLNALSETEKVILVGHSCGGAVVSYAVEHFPKKVSKAVFVSATMISNGQRPFDVFSEYLGPAEVFLKESQFLLYGNGKEKPATGLQFGKEHIKALYFNQTTPKDIALAAVSMRPVLIGPIMEKLTLTPENYGSVRKFFIQTLDDRIISPDTQEKMIRDNPPERVFKIKGSDHCPFFSKPQSLYKHLLEIAASESIELNQQNSLMKPWMSN